MLGLETNWPEEFYSRSVEGVLRGLHLLTPPHHQSKIVTCVQGVVLDVIVDLRVGSPAFGKHFLFELSAERANMIYVGKGVAHGFYVPSGEAILHYRVSTMYSAPHDKCIRWDSAGIPWPTVSPFVSARDAALPPLQEFSSPFPFQGVHP